jgi:hypothetical protein
VLEKPIEVDMKSNLMKCGVIAALSFILSACVVAPPQPIGYRMSAPMLPTYVNGQYVGMQPSNYIAPASAPAPAPVASGTNNQQQATQTVAAQPAQQQSPVYLQSTTPSVVYVQAPQPVYSPYYGPGYYPYGGYPYPYYSPFYAGPWWGGVGIGVGLRVRIR